MGSKRQRILGIKTIVTALMFIFLLSSANLAAADQYVPIGTGEPYNYYDIPFQVGGVGLQVKRTDDEFVPVKTIDLTGYVANKIHILETGVWATNVPDGTVVGKINVFYEDGSSNSTDLIMGVNIAEWSYDRPENQCCLAHAKIPPAFSWWTNIDSESYYWGHYFYVSMDTEKKPLNYLELLLDPASYTGQPPCPAWCEFRTPENLFGIDLWAITLEISQGQEMQISIDIKPGSCPNPLDVSSHGVLPVAIIGTADLDVSEVDLTTVSLAGVQPLRSSYEDVAAPYQHLSEIPDPYDCNTERADGILDIILHFDVRQLVAALGEVNNREALYLDLTAQLYDGTVLLGQDVILIIKNKK